MSRNKSASDFRQRLATTGWPLLCLFVTVLTAACSGNNGRFRLEGKFSNFNVGEFYIYDIDNGHIDTIPVSDSRLAYDIPMKDTVVLSIVFPNYSEIPVVAMPGTKAKIEGDVSHLRDTKVSGNRVNEELTDLRMAVNQQSPKETKETIARFIKGKPQTPLAAYLLRRYFIDTAEPDLATARQLIDTVATVQEGNRRLMQLRQAVTAAANSTRTTLPSFALTDSEGRTVGNKDLRGEVNAVLIWATWSTEGSSMMRQLNREKKKLGERLAVVSVAIDATPDVCRRIMKSDSIKWPNICDGNMWQSTLAVETGTTQVPICFLADRNGKILRNDIRTSKQLTEALDNLTSK